MTPTEYQVGSGIYRFRNEYGWDDPKSYVTITIKPNDVTLHLTLPQAAVLIQELERETLTASLKKIEEDK